MGNCYINLNCGGCDAIMEMNTDFEEAAWLMVYRFANAHVQCGYVMPVEHVQYEVQFELPPDDQPPEEDDEPVEDDEDGEGWVLVP